MDDVDDDADIEGEIDADELLDDVALWDPVDVNDINDVSLESGERVDEAE